jgi:hypothetical protein
MRLPHVLTLVGICAAGAAAAVVHSFNSFSAEPVAFSKEGWHRLRADVESSADPGCVLGPLAQDLVQSGHLSRRSGQYVVEQLGQPSKRQGSELVYSLGQCHGWGWHHSELVVRLSEQGTVVSAEPRLTE